MFKTLKVINYKRYHAPCQVNYPAKELRGHLMHIHKTSQRYLQFRQERIHARHIRWLKAAPTGYHYFRELNSQI